MERPQWYFWVLAGLVAWLIAPLATVLLWDDLIQAAREEKLRVSHLEVALYSAYSISLPYATVGVTLLVTGSFSIFDRVAMWPWWLWACLGGLAGMMIVFISLGLAWPQNDFERRLVGSGITSGVVTALVYRATLLSGIRDLV